MTSITTRARTGRETAKDAAYDAAQYRMLYFSFTHKTGDKAYNDRKTGNHANSVRCLDGV